MTEFVFWVLLSEEILGKVVWWFYERGDIEMLMGAAKGEVIAVL